MGIFTDLFVNNEPYHTCSVCGKNEARKKLNDGYICKECKKRCWDYCFLFPCDWHNMDLARVQRAIENYELLKIYQPNRKIKKHIGFDDANRLFQTMESGPVNRYEELVSWELVQNGMGIIKGGIRKDTSAVTGAAVRTERVYQFEIQIYTENKGSPTVYIELLQHGAIQYGDWRYREYLEIARQIIRELDKIAESMRQEEPVVVSNTVSGADEILKYKNLLDQGILTPEEFESKKKQILGL